VIAFECSQQRTASARFEIRVSSGMLVKELIKAFLLLLCYVAANPALSRPGTLRYTLTDIVQVCGDGESILHAMQYSLIKRQRLLKESDVSGPETAAVRVVIARTV
jgi:rRNA maturation protein Nop10